METKQQKFVLPIIVMIFLFGMISFVTNLASPMGDILKYQFNVPNWMSTLGVFANFIAYAIMGYPAGSMLQRYGYKKTALIAVSVGFIGVGIQTLSGTVESFGVYLLGAFIAGFSMCLLNTVVNPMLNKLGGGGNKGNQLIQTGGSFNSLCGTAVIILTGLLIPEGIKNAQISNVFPLMYAALAIFAFAFIVLALTRIPENIQYCPSCGARTGCAGKPRKDKTAAGLLAIFLGGLGIHYFYMGKTTAGIISLIIGLCSCYIWGLVMLIQGILILTMTDEAFMAKYVDTDKSFPLF